MTLEIGERRRAERELRETEERYRHLVEELPAVIYTWQVRPSKDGTEHWYISPQLEQLIGFTPTEFLDGGWDTWYERVHPHDRDRVYEVAMRCARTGDAFEEEYRFLDRDGRVVWVLDSATLMQRDAAGRPFIYQGVMLDIGARKLAEDKAAAAESRFRELVESGPTMAYAYEIVSRDPFSIRIDHVSPRIAEAIGYTAGDLGDDLSRWFSMVHPDDRERLTAEAHRTWAVGGEYSTGYRMIAADGNVVWLNDRGRCVSRDDAGAPRRFVGTMLDVTAEREEHLELRDRHERMRAVLEGLPTIPWTEIVDPATGWRRYTYIGPQVVDAFGYTPEELIAEPRHFERMAHPDDLERVQSLATAAEQTGDSWEDVYRVVTRDGQEVWVHSRGRRVSIEGVVPAVWHGVGTVIDEEVAAALLETLGRTVPSGASETAPTSLA
jgi:PAS domain S-box-containing protein